MKSKKICLQKSGTLRPFFYSDINTKQIIKNLKHLSLN